MIRAKLQVHWCLAVVVVMGMAVAANAQGANLSAAEIVSKNAAARGGLQAWHNVQTLSMSGKMQAGGYHEPPVVVAPKHRRPVVTQPKETVQQVELPFRMELKRSRKQRLEVDFNGKTSVQVYDGATGWLMRPYLNRNDYEPFTAEQAKAVSEEADLDGYLIDYAAKGTTVALVSTEKVGGRDNYKLKLTLKNGYSLHVWVDAQTYLETKMDGTPRRLDGEYRPVEVYLSDYRSVNGVMVPFQLETKVNYVPYGSRQPKTFSEKITIENVTVNRNLDDSAFTKPKSEVAAGAPQPLTPKSTSVSR